MLTTPQHNNSMTKENTKIIAGNYISKEKKTYFIVKHASKKQTAKFLLYKTNNNNSDGYYYAENGLKIYVKFLTSLLKEK